jgi:hypothetical protein
MDGISPKILNDAKQFVPQLWQNHKLNSVFFYLSNLSPTKSKRGLGSRSVAPGKKMGEIKR